MLNAAVTVAIVDPRQDTAELLAEMLIAAGIRPVNAYTHLKRGLLDFVAFIAEDKPAAIIWNAGPAYSDNWMCLQLLRASPALANCRVFTTTSSLARNSVLGPSDPDEVASIPGDLERVLDAVQSYINA